jgi:hypothetical protein
MSTSFYTVKLAPINPNRLHRGELVALPTGVHTARVHVSASAAIGEVVAQECEVGVRLTSVKLAVADNTYITAAAAWPQISKCEAVDTLAPPEHDHASAMRC